eukprot:gene11665-4930_t
MASCTSLFLSAAVILSNCCSTASTATTATTTVAGQQQQHEQLIGVSWDLSAPDQLGVVSVNVSTGEHTMLKKLGAEALLIVEAAYDAAHRVFYMLTGAGTTLSPLQIASGTYLPIVTLDVSGCGGGSPCFQELVFNPATRSIVAAGVGYGKAQTSVAVVSISVKDGSVIPIGYIPGTCALTMDASALDVAAQIYYLTADCGANEHDSTIFAFNIAKPAQRLPFVLNGTAYYDTNPLFVGDGSLYALNGSEHVVRVHDNATAPVGGPANVGGIPSNHGVAVNAAGSVAWMSVAYFTTNRLVSVDLSTGAVASQPFPFAVEHLVYDIAPT